LQIVKGMNDILPPEQKFWEFFLTTAIAALKMFSFLKIDTPILEFEELFKRGVGASTDIVEKEMFSFVTKGRDKVALRPEGTAGVARAYIENGMSSWPQPVKLFYYGPMFRYEKPQLGRRRQFHQLGAEIIGSSDPVSDAQIIALSWQILDNLGLQNLSIQINSVGCLKCRGEYRNLFTDSLCAKVGNLCADCKNRFKKNPWRILDCKEVRCQRLTSSSPIQVDYLCSECHDHFRSVLEFLDESDLPYALNPKLVRGLDYYTKTVFEFVTQEKNAGAILGGGRYDDLIEFLGGRSAPAVGMSMGIERIIEIMKQNKIKPRVEDFKIDVFLAQLGDLPKKKALKLFLDLEKEGFKVAEAFSKNSLRSQLAIAEKLKIPYALILGQKEALDGNVILRNLSSGVQEFFPLCKIIEVIKKRIK